MFYEPTNGKTGDIVTSAKLNKLENGVANSAGFLKVTTSYDSSTKILTMDKTWQEIYDVFSNGGYVTVMDVDSEQPYATQAPITQVDYSTFDGNYYRVIIDNDRAYICDTANDYPYLDKSNEPS